ncbi:MAG TPA: hypothetical protein VJM13_02285, partial [Sphingopyxis sp.]|nr:hypothetical protein [Sphingopyxis sp.]
DAIALPPAAEPLDAYGRYYRYAEPGKVAAVFLIPIPPRDTDGCSVVTRSSGMRDCTAAEIEEIRDRDAAVAARQLAAGKRRWMPAATDIPEISDGGCMQINILYEVAARRFLFVACNGDA